MQKQQCCRTVGDQATFLNPLCAVFCATSEDYSIIMHILREKLQSCLHILGYGGHTCIGDISWLNVYLRIQYFSLLFPNLIVYFVLQDFCAEFLLFSNTVQKYISNQTEQDSLEIVCLCLTQIIICIRHLEYTVQTESTSGQRIQVNNESIVGQVNVLTSFLFFINLRPAIIILLTA